MADITTLHPSIHAALDRIFTRDGELTECPAIDPRDPHTEGPALRVPTTDVVRSRVHRETWLLYVLRAANAIECGEDPSEAIASADRYCGRQP